jgi:hypothetical protein
VADRLSGRHRQRVGITGLGYRRGTGRTWSAGRRPPRCRTPGRHASASRQDRQADPAVMLRSYQDPVSFSPSRWWLLGTQSVWSALRAAHEDAGKGVGRRPVPIRFLARDDRVAVTVRPLQEAPTAGGQVKQHLRPVQPERRHVDDVEIRTISRPEHSAVVEAHGASCVASLALDDEGQAQACVTAIPGPVLEQGRREASVADRAERRRRIGPESCAGARASPGRRPGSRPHS